MANPPQAAGTHTLTEILSQRQCWRDCLDSLETDGQRDRLGKQIEAEAESLFIGCGSSCYIAQAAASSWTALPGRRARVIPASELLLELKLDVPEFARLAAYAFAGQLLGYYTGLNKGHDPDPPRHLSRAVILNSAEGGTS